ncbi:MAG: hypothetical protein EXQ84_05465 [Rhodospirillaceae bacterium]|nr:hypothetical protein [Rhodospirillaceae bacterium]
MTGGWARTFKTTLNPARLKTMLSSVCRQPLSLEIEAHDTAALPPYRIVEARFSTQEDFDRAGLFLQRLGKELMSHPVAAPRAGDAGSATDASASSARERHPARGPRARDYRADAPETRRN